MVLLVPCLSEKRPRRFCCWRFMSVQCASVSQCLYWQWMMSAISVGRDTSSPEQSSASLQHCGRTWELHCSCRFIKIKTNAGTRDIFSRGYKQLYTTSVHSFHNDWQESQNLCGWETIVLGCEGEKQRSVVTEEVFLIDSVFQTQQLTWDQRHLLHLPLPLKHTTHE